MSVSLGGGDNIQGRSQDVWRGSILIDSTAELKGGRWRGRVCAKLSSSMQKAGEAYRA